MTTVINLYGGPGTGKSTSAAYLFYLLKTNGEEVELVREYVKNWAWEKRHISTYDQIYFVGKQVRSESLLYGKVNWIVTDSPVLLSTYYARQYSPSIADGVEASVRAYYRQAAKDGHHHVHVFLNRTKRYVAAGRYQTEEQAKQIDADLKHLLKEQGLDFIECGTDAAALSDLLIKASPSL